MNEDWVWTGKHRWVKTSNIVLTSNPPQYHWGCQRCGAMITANKPPDDFCPGLVN